MGTRMMRTIVRTVAAACLLAASAAQAAYYSSRWDPLGLEVNAVIKVSDCNPSPSSALVPANNGSSCTASLYSLVATLTEVDTSGNPVPNTPPAYIDFITPDGFRGNPEVSDDNSTDIIDGLYFSAEGELLGIKWAPLTLLSLFCPLDHSLCPVIGWPPKEENPTPRELPNDGPWQLMIVNDDPANGLLSTAYLLDWHCELYRRGRCVDVFRPRLEVSAPVDVVWDPDRNTMVADIRYAGETEPNLDERGKVAAVPEPGSLALFAGALGAGWVTRRRRSAR